ncbi:hypothetical protein [Paracoccus litorisediminis]|uniref:Head-tail adaptor n=1 Tax=Paracoccus litorisediminis TaxID=2006130 RepID=A0A844HPY5_9RHOB|nr:hypothetical protein [Paracoccus litorisediminis]MTH61199.1 hypothetical protein [Paracoccus litorisediminis]
MFRPNQTGHVTSALELNIYGEAVPADPFAIRFAVVRLGQDVKSGDATDELVSTARGRILVARDTAIRIGDHFTFDGLRYEVVGKEPRFAISGALDHFDVRLELRP